MEQEIPCDSDELGTSLVHSEGNKNKNKKGMTELGSHMNSAGPTMVPKEKMDGGQVREAGRKV